MENAPFVSDKVPPTVLEVFKLTPAILSIVKFVGPFEDGYSRLVDEIVCTVVPL